MERCISNCSTRGTPGVLDLTSGTVSSLMASRGLRERDGGQCCLPQTLAWLRALFQTHSWRIEAAVVRSGAADSNLAVHPSRTGHVPKRAFIGQLCAQHLHEDVATLEQAHTADGSDPLSALDVAVCTLTLSTVENDESTTRATATRTGRCE